MQLRPYQEEAKQAIFDEWNKPHPVGIADRVR